MFIYACFEKIYANMNYFSLSRVHQMAFFKKVKKSVYKINPWYMIDVTS